MSRFDPEMSNDRFYVDYRLTDNPGDPYRFTLKFELNDGRTFTLDGLSMGDLDTIKKTINETVRTARSARKAHIK